MIGGLDAVRASLGQPGAAARVADMVADARRAEAAWALTRAPSDAPSVASRIARAGVWLVRLLGWTWRIRVSTR